MLRREGELVLGIASARAAAKELSIAMERGSALDANLRSAPCRACYVVSHDIVPVPLPRENAD